MTRMKAGRGEVIRLPSREPVPTPSGLTAVTFRCGHREEFWYLQDSHAKLLREIAPKHLC